MFKAQPIRPWSSDPAIILVALIESQQAEAKYMKPSPLILSFPMCVCEHMHVSLGTRVSVLCP